MLGGRYLVDLFHGTWESQTPPKDFASWGSRSGSPGADLHSLSTYLGKYQGE